MAVESEMVQMLGGQVALVRTKYLVLSVYFLDLWVQKKFWPQER